MSTLNFGNVSRFSLSNSTAANSTGQDNYAGDATWILTSAFIIFTMQSGFGLLESGMVSRKNETSIMVKNAVDVIYGGLAYWIFGFGFSFGKSEYSNYFCGIGYFLTDSADTEKFGWIHAKFFFQLSFATTATTIVSGAMAERTNLKAYTLFSFVSVLTYCFPAHWVWDEETGWLRKLGYVDIAGATPVHVVGGVNGLMATIMLKPRYGRFDAKGRPCRMEISSPTNILLGTFMLWWGWLGFNCGSTFGISGGKWKLASRSAVTTLNSSVGGAVFAMIFSYITEKNILSIPIFVTGIISGLVSITGICAVCRPGEALIIGFIGSLFACCGSRLLEKLNIDDPVCCVPVHCFAGVWSVISVALFAEIDSLEKFTTQSGLFKGGSWRFLGIQLLGVTSIALWAGIVGLGELYLIDRIVGLRVSLMEEIIGADQCEHGIADAANLKKLSRSNVYSSAGVRVRLARTRRRTFAFKDPRHHGTLSFNNRRTCRRRLEENIELEPRKVAPGIDSDGRVLRQQAKATQNERKEVTLAEQNEDASSVRSVSESRDYVQSVVEYVAITLKRPQGMDDVSDEITEIADEEGRKDELSSRTHVTIIEAHSVNKLSAIRKDEPDICAVRNYRAHVILHENNSTELTPNERLTQIIKQDNSATLENNISPVDDQTAHSNEIPPTTATNNDKRTVDNQTAHGNQIPPTAATSRL